MSSENGYQCSPAQPAASIHESRKQSIISYTRDFLLSLNELDICKKLPSGFDPSVLSEFEDAPHSILERQRTPGSLSLQSFRRSEYGSSPPTRGDSSNYSRVTHGRWDGRSSGPNDKDSDSQSDWDSDSGRHYGNQSRHFGQNPEHDGLLGSGTFPRPSGYTAGASAPKIRGNGQYQLNRSNEPYHPPRPYKAVPHSRRDATDSHNDETFGSSDCSSEDRAEEERKRRVRASKIMELTGLVKLTWIIVLFSASFELMRKEQQKAFQEKQKQPDKHKSNFDRDIAKLLGDSKDDKRLLNKNNESEEYVIPPASHNDSSKCSFPTQTPASRPLVPPGFTSTIREKNLGTKSLVDPTASEVGNLELENKLMLVKGNPLADGTNSNQEEKQSAQHTDFSEQQPETKSIHVSFINESERILFPSSSVEVSDNSVGAVNPSYKTSNLSETCEAQEDGEVIEFDSKKVTGHKSLGTSGQDHSTSILEKIFSSALTGNAGGSSSSVEYQETDTLVNILLHQYHDVKADETWSPIPVESSKFAHLFHEEEKKPVDDNLSSGKHRDLLSLIVGSEKVESQMSGMSDEKETELIPPNFHFESNELRHKFMTSTPTSATVEISESLYYCNKQDAALGVLTCEDLEQSMLSEINENSSSLPHTAQGWNVSDAKTEQPKAVIDNRASQHLLSLLQKGTSLKNLSPSANLDIGSSDILHVFEGSVSTVLNSSSEGNPEKHHNTEKSLTLETLFGTAFMMELQSVEAPVSIQRGSVGGLTRSDVSERHGLAFPVADDAFFPSTVGDYGSNGTSYEGNVLTSNHIQPTKSDKIEGHWLGFDDPRTEVRSKFQTEVGSRHSAVCGFDDKGDREVEIRLPEEDSLITVDDPGPPNSMFMPSRNASKAELLSSNKAVDFAEKLAALNDVHKDERSMVPGMDGPPFYRGPYDPMDPEILYQKLHVRPSSPPIHHHRMNHGRPLFHPLDSHPAHMNSQIKFMGPDSIIHHFPANMLNPPFQHPPAGPTRFDPPAHHSVLQQMRMPGNFPPPHVLQGLPRGAPLPHPISNNAGYRPELNPMQGFPLSNRQPTYGGLGMPMLAPGVDGGGGSNHPEAFERLIEMELRANSKQMHPIATAAHSQGMYGHELDMGFRYR
ncbi:hypothetical protein HHK36_029026 [Tetracentron sinense]|uniref:Uncharacterized protein n=1 Tax=Tetracentron sinense TaxID=13715 RepID=A0A835D181_TETSI|nr:hypothetical protein HHK36_029026 [Tetracentron sinense]